jgi:hypothetical protein
MRWLVKLLGTLSSALTLGCVATVAAQITGVAVASSQGLLSPDKVLRYAGVLYGLDPLDMSTGSGDTSGLPKAQTREEILVDRVAKTPHLAERTTLVLRDAEEARGTTLALKRNREKYVSARDGFEALLDQLETDTETSALRELQITIEITSPKQAKDILTNMLATAPADPADNVMADITDILKSLPDNRLRKILAEFKTEEERVVLHQLLVEIGDLDLRNAQLSGTQP